jgi:hypothetical protein
LLTAGLYSLVRVHQVADDDRFQQYLKGFPASIDGCERARAHVGSTAQGAATFTEMRDFCSEVSTFQTLEFVFFGAAAASAGAGIYLLATDSSNRSAAAARVQVDASAGPRGGDVRVRVRF